MAGAYLGGAGYCRTAEPRPGYASAVDRCAVRLAQRAITGVPRAWRSRSGVSSAAATSPGALATLLMRGQAPQVLVDEWGDSGQGFTLARIDPVQQGRYFSGQGSPGNTPIPHLCLPGPKSQRFSLSCA